MDVFGNNTTIKADNRTLSTNNVLCNMDGDLSLVQSARITYAQAVRPTYEAGSYTTYLVVGNPSGRAELATIVGSGNGLLGGFTQKLKGDCQFNTLTFKANGDCPTISIEKTAICKGCVPQEIGFAFQVGQLSVMSSLGMYFVSLETDS